MDTGKTTYLTSAELGRIRRAVGIARLMDTAVRLPIIGVRIGADSVLGLIPAIGDVAGSLIGLFIIDEARRLGLPGHKLARMAANLGVDAACGTTSRSCPALFPWSGIFPPSSATCRACCGVRNGRWAATSG